MPSTCSIRERDEPLPSLLAQWRTPSASRATATRSASYNQAVVSSPATASTASRPTSTTANATTKATPDEFGPTRSRSSTATTRAPFQQPTTSSTANSTRADSDSESDSSASSLEGLAKRLKTARQAKSKTRRRDTGAAAEAESDKASVRRRKKIEGHEKDTAETASDRSASIDDARGGGSASRSGATRSSRPSGTSSPSSLALAQRSRPVSPSTTTTDRAPADFDSGPTVTPGAAPDAPDRREDDDDDDSGMASSSDEDDEDEEEGDTSAAYVVSHAEGHPDPRDLLRAQLARPITARSTSRPSLRSNRTDSRTDTLSADRTSHPQTSKPTDKADSTALDNDKAADALLYLPRRYFILSTAGKLVYTSDPNEEAATGLVGVMQAIVSIFADEGDKIRYIDAGQTRISFLLKAPLYLVVVSSRGEPEPVLRQHLEYLYLQVLSVVTLAQLQSIFAKRSNFDLRQLIAGTEPFFDSITSSLQTSFAILLSSISVYRLSPSLRSQLARALDPGKEAIRDLDLLYVLLLAEGRLVTLLRPKKHSIHPTDLHLLLSTIYAPRRRGSRSEEEDDNEEQQQSSAAAAQSAPDEKRQSRRSRPSPLVEPGAEAWLPICLPRFNSHGFLHAYVSFLETGSDSSKSNGGDAAEGFMKLEGDEAGGGGAGGVGLVILSSRRDAFAGVQSTAQAIRHRLLSSPASTTSSSLQAPPPSATTSAVGAAPDGGLVHSILMARAHQSYSLGEVAVPGLRHFVYKDRERVQVTMPRWEGEYDVEEHGAEAERARMRLMTLYQRLHQSLHATSGSSLSAQHRGDREAGAPSSAAAAAPSVQYLRTSREAVLGWVTTDFELYVSTSPLLPHAAVVSCARSVSKWVKQDSARLFLSGKGAGVF